MMADGQAHYTSAELALENARTAEVGSDQNFFLQVALVEATLALANQSNTYT
jgi:hypothetical protein